MKGGALLNAARGGVTHQSLKRSASSKSNFGTETNGDKSGVRAELFLVIRMKIGLFYSMQQSS